jgi:hypothetical protein
VVLENPVAIWVTVTAAPEIAADDGSVTIPDNLADATWAWTGATTQRISGSLKMALLNFAIG